MQFRKADVSMLKVILSVVLFVTTSFSLADLDAANKMYDDKDYATAFKLYKEMSEKSCDRVCFPLGFMYEKGLGVIQDNKQSFFWYQKAAEQGDVSAQYKLGDIYEQNKDYQNAVNWWKKIKNRKLKIAGVGGGKQSVYRYQKAADQGDAFAQNSLGNIYESGDHVAQDYKQAIVWYQKAADQGYATAQLHLGDMYANGKGVAQDYQQALFWYQKAVDQGDEDAQIKLGDIYKSGQGVAQNYQQALFWYQKAADNYYRARIKLAEMYSMGEGIPNDYKLALFWYKKAEEKNIARDILFLGDKYYDVADYQQAKYWYQKAADQGFEPAIQALEKLKAMGK